MHPDTVELLKTPGGVMYHIISTIYAIYCWDFQLSKVDIKDKALWQVIILLYMYIL